MLRDRLGFRIASFALAVTVGAGGSARAVTTTVRNACRADAMRLCHSVIHDEAKRHACMQAHKAQLSKACIDAVVKSRQHG
jgi:hypothetical protein